ncbi:kinesin-like protein KIF20A [Rhinatrema bivittatum]|uniref:kinesin-like protein KIF20A n=1 Tax=Rhinatrema bivittatum TaxID=194408 RepID=UPI00112D670C|nr:kinesin-like protein KIF20A [Rhinatrema bivittatum]XP_029439175.1 kinesin-like protein KIF20A [Rhinatrema bivittatum]XP_029439176.1 kinesin-like protein KIF20A [Rhinatrema bivittatum]
MAQEIFSPNPGIFSDEEEAPVFESTAAEFGAGIQKDLLNDFSLISPGMGAAKQGAEVLPSALHVGSDKVKVYLRVRPFLETELEKKEDQGCVVIEDAETLLLHAPKDSFTMRSTERGVGQAVHRFSFSQIFGPDVAQREFFEGTMRGVVSDVLNGHNWLIYTYGVTNSGKTHTVQGSSKEGGILPRSLALIFSSIQEKLYKGSDLKPSLSEVRWLDSRQVQQEEARKAALLSGLREEDLLTPLKNHLSISSDSGIAGISSVQQTGSQLEDSASRWADPDGIALQNLGDLRFSVWVSFFEIYNEFLYDLLEQIPCGPNRKRIALRLSEDKNGNPYVRDLNWINVCNAEEAWKMLRIGRKNQSFASTHLNQSSSRSHSIFSIRILHLQEGPELAPRISELSLCDLAGSERCKDQRCGDRMKEANNINTSLHTLGRCLRVLRQNQQLKMRQNVVPFRDSKLTRILQAFFTGHGRSCMIVNINQCASTYDETLHALKFSAIASQLVQSPPLKLHIPSIQSLVMECSLAEDEMEADSEADVTVFSREDLLEAIEAMKERLLKERKDRVAMELRIREEVCAEMIEELQKREKDFSEHLETEKELLEEMYENRLENLKESLTKYYKHELKDKEERIKELEEALQHDVSDISIKQQELEQPLRRSKRVAAASSLQQEVELIKQQLLGTKAELDQCQSELEKKSKELIQYRKLVEPSPFTGSLTLDVDRKLEDGQKHVRMLRSELQKLGNSLQSAVRACCHNTSAEKLRLTLNACHNILAKQDQTLAELQNNMMLVKLDLRKKAVCIAEQYQTVQKLQGTPSFSKKRPCTNVENLQPGKKAFLSFLPRAAGQQSIMASSPYTRILRARQTPLLKAMAFSTKY